MHLNTLQACFLLPLAAFAGKQLDPISNKIGWEQIWEDDCSARCGVGTRSLRVACVDDWMEQSDKSICTDAVGASTLATSEPCNVKCFYVDPLKGKDSNAGTSAAAAFLSVGACTAKASSPSDTTKHNTRCILLGTALYDKPQTGASGLADLWGVTIEPETGQTVVFDGTAPAVFASDWKTSGSIKVATLSATSTPTASRRPDVIVEGRAIQCAKQAAINDGGHDDKSGWATKRPPCFMWDPELSWVVGKRAFAYDDAVAFYESGTASLLDGSNSKNLPWFWFDQATRKLYVHPELAQKQVDAGRTLSSVTKPNVRVVDKSRFSGIKLTENLEHVYLRGLQFYGTGQLMMTAFDAIPHQTGSVFPCHPAEGSGTGCWNHGKFSNNDLRVENSKWLYSPGVVGVSTSSANGRGSHERLTVKGCSFEFGQGSLHYQANGAVVSENYFAFNSFEKRGKYTANNKAIRTNFNANTLLYNGDIGGHYHWGYGHWCHHNLIIGSDFLGPKFDAAVFHAQISAQKRTVIEYNWCLGPSNVLCVRLDTAKSSTYPGLNMAVRFNLAMGQTFTMKGYNHTFEHNTGTYAQIIWDWGEIDDHNQQSYFRYNAISVMTSRGSKALDTAIPGYAAPNMCVGDKDGASKLSQCNPSLSETWLVPPALATAVTNAGSLDTGASNGICKELNSGCWPFLQQGTEGEDVGSATLDALASMEPYDVPTPTLADTPHDFRPKTSSTKMDLTSTVGSSICKNNDQTTYSYTNKQVVPVAGTNGAFDCYFGAYQPSPAALWVPGQKISRSKFATPHVNPVPVVPESSNPSNAFNTSNCTTNANCTSVMSDQVITIIVVVVVVLIVAGMAAAGYYCMKKPPAPTTDKPAGEGAESAKPAESDPAGSEIQI